MKWLCYGHAGWIGGQFINLLKEQHPEIEILLPTSRANDPAGVERDLTTYQPDRVILMIGRTSGPGFNTIDYLEQPGRLVDNIRDNLYSPLLVMKLCEIKGIHCTYLGTGCIFSYEKPDDPPFTVNSVPNFTGSSYSTVKGFTDQLAGLFSNVLNVRIRMPISSSDHPRNFISKIIRYPFICNTLNSMSVLDDVLPVLIQQIIEEQTGTIHLVNPEPIDHVTILELYRKYIDPEHTYTLMTESQQDQMLAAKRSKNTLVPSFDLPPTRISVERILKGDGFRKK